ncbi:MAG: hypothetical protein FJZ90_09005, partial [Chloroflexi bacterium]|nr:hypothetical protein [Chloroflexota bacterium]
LPLFGEWVPLSLDEVLQKVEDEYAAAIDPGGRFSAEELNILKMATTAWYLGQSAILKIGTLTIQDLEKVLTDPQMVLAFLDEDGLLPTGFKEVVDVLLEVFKAGGPVAWLEQQWNKVMGVIDDVGEFFEGSFLDFSPDTSPPSAQESEPEEEPSEPSAPLDEKILGWTQTAITVLNVLATITGWAWLGEVATILTKIVEIYQKIRALCDTIKALMDSIGKPFETAMQTLSVELGTLAKPMSLVGLVFAVATIWLGVALQLGDVGPSVGLTIVVEAIVQTILVVVLFVVAAIFPFGTIVAIAIGLIQLLQDLLGFVFDPISLLLDWLFSVEAIQRTAVLGDPQFGQLKMEALEPGGGVLGGRKFRLKLPAIITMITVNGGDAGDLLQSAAALHLGRFVAAPKTPVSICSPSEDLFEEYKKALAGYVVDEFHAMYNHCVLFKLPRVPYWVFSSPSSASTGEDPVEVFPGIYTRELLTASRLDIEPSGSINGLLTFDVSIDVTFRYDACSTCCGCDEGTSTSTSPPAINKLYFDILPGWLPGLWGWPALYNPDPDGDGLWGYAHPETGNPIGPDGNLCPGLAKSWERWDTDDDGLSDKFELETQGYDPCNKDSDGDGWEDGRELMFGTRPDDPDTDGDGLTDKEELPYSSFYGWQAPWRVSLKALYPGLPDPVAFPNPRQANLDRDHRGDKKERAKYSSPNAFNPIPVGEAIDLGLTQVLQAGGGTRLTVSTPPWPNDEAAAIGPTLTITLPVAFSGLTLSARLYPSLGSRLDYGIPLRSETPNVYKWMLPPITLSRYLLATLAGIPDIPSGPVTVTAQLAYTEGATSQVSTAAAPLKVNTGGPSTAVVQVDGALVLQPAGANDQGTGEEPAGDEVVIWGTASDPEQVSQVFVCVKTTDTCDGGDWQPATVSYGALLAGVPQYWSYSFTPAEDNVYYVRAYGVDWFQVAGPVSEPWVIGVDRKPPSRVRFDLRGTAYLSTTTSLDGSPVIALTGRISDTIGAPYVSGVDAVALLADGQAVETVDVTDQGQASSSFTVQWTPSILRTGRSLRSTNGVHRLTVGGRDVAGNICPVSDTLHVLVDDTPPVVYAHPPQTLATSTQPFPLRLTLSGLADDTALVRGRQPEHPFASTLTVGDRDALFDVGVDRGRAVIVGDVTGDLIDDVVLFVPATVGFAPVPFRAGLFYGKPAGFRDTLFLADADVLFQGELPVVLRDWGPSAAGLGDINGDGVGDLLLGDPSAGSGQGRAYVVLGRRGGGWSSPFSLANADWRLSVAETTAFGGTVGAAGDVNGDGLNDLVVGADSYQNYKSVAWLFLGRERGAAVARAAFYAPSKLASGPPGLAGLGDTNGDGLAELLIAPEGTDVALLYGRPDGEWPAGPTNLGALADVLFSAPGTGQTVSPAGDVNGNGLRDM